MRTLVAPTLVFLAALAGCGSETTTCDPACATTAVCVDGVCVPRALVPDAAVSHPDASTGPDAARADASSNDDASSDDASVDPTDGGALLPDASAPVVVLVTITPTIAALVSTNGATVSQSYAVVAEYSDGSTVAIAAPVLRVDPAVLGSISGAQFIANGRVGGEGRVLSTVDGVEGISRLIVRLEEETLLPGTPTTAPTLFEVLVTDPSREANLLYPLDRAVMPQNVPPAEIQWERSAPGDIFRVTLSKPNVSALVYNGTAVPGFQNSLAVALDGWRRIAQSEPDEWATITVDRWISATQESIRGTPVQIRFARAALLGSIYYWDIARGRIVRINDGTTTRDEFMPSPQLGCVGCHTVSPSGRFMAGRLGGGDNVAAVYDLTTNLTGAPPPTMFPVTSTTVRWIFASWSPDETRLVVSDGELGGSARRLQLVDPFRGAYLTPLTGTMPVGNVTQPVWSKDGADIAYVGNANSWGGEMTAGDLFMLPVTGPDAIGTPVRILTGTTSMGAPAGNSISYPSWSPGSDWVAFAHGSSSRSENGRAALYMVRRDGSGLVRLDRASGGVTADLSFQPRFSPFEQDGYYWLTFLSRRDYGNSQAGTRFTSRQQIWVTAIKTNPLPGEDPSEVSYWLPGQNTQSLNIAADWAARACLEETLACSIDAECCSGECAPGPNGDVCVPLSQCRKLGEACQASEQCCEGQLCVGGTCGGV